MVLNIVILLTVLIVYTIATIIDGTCTIVGLHYSIVKELNPIILMTMSVVGIWGIILVKFIALDSLVLLLQYVNDNCTQKVINTVGVSVLVVSLLTFIGGTYWIPLLS